MSSVEGNLTSIVRQFAEKHTITCPETIYQTDSVIVDAYRLIEELLEAGNLWIECDDEADLG